MFPVLKIRAEEAGFVRRRPMTRTPQFSGIGE